MSSANHISASIGNTTTMEKKELKQFLRSNGGAAMACGYLCDVKTEHLGAGVYRVWLEKKEYPR